MKSQRAICFVEDFEGLSLNGLEFKCLRFLHYKTNLFLKNKLSRQYKEYWWLYTTECKGVYGFRVR